MHQQPDPIEYERPDWTADEMPNQAPFSCHRMDIKRMAEAHSEARSASVGRLMIAVTVVGCLVVAGSVMWTRVFSVFL